MRDIACDGRGRDRRRHDAGLLLAAVTLCGEEKFEPGAPCGRSRWPRCGAAPHIGHAVRRARTTKASCATHHRALIAPARTVAVRGRRAPASTPTDRAAGSRPTTKRRCRSLGAEQSNASAAVGDSVLLKFYRRVETGIHPEIEMGRYLTERRASSIRRASWAHVELRRREAASGRARGRLRVRHAIRATPGRWSPTRWTAPLEESSALNRRRDARLPQAFALSPSISARSSAGARPICTSRLRAPTERPGLRARADRRDDIAPLGGRDPRPRPRARSMPSSRRRKAAAGERRPSASRRCWPERDKISTRARSLAPAAGVGHARRAFMATIHLGQILIVAGRPR